jgi:hypothetical protein
VQPVDDRRLDYRWVTDAAALEELVTTLVDQPRYALDTEFHRERTYFPQLALMQIAWREGNEQRLVLVDPLAIDVAAFGRLFASDCALCDPCGSARSRRAHPRGRLGSGANVRHATRRRVRRVRDAVARVAPAGRDRRVAAQG